MISKRYYIYRLYWPGIDEIGCYIGVSYIGSTRYYNHVQRLLTGKHTNTAFQIAFDSIGVAPDIEIMEYAKDLEDARDLEMSYIRKFNKTCFNIQGHDGIVVISKREVSTAIAAIQRNIKIAKKAGFRAFTTSVNWRIRLRLVEKFVEQGYKVSMNLEKGDLTFEY